MLTTLEDERAAQKDRKLAALVPRLRLALEDLTLERDIARDMLDYQISETRRLDEALKKMEAERDAQWSPMTWTLIGAGGALLGSLALAFALVLL